MVESSGAGDKEWILEVIQDFLLSPQWKNPIVDFVEENCFQFEDVEENKLIYTDIHNKFKALIER